MGTERENPVGALGAGAETSGKSTGMTAKSAAEGDTVCKRQDAIKGAPGIVTPSSEMKVVRFAVVAVIGDVVNIVGQHGGQRVEPLGLAEGVYWDESPGLPDA